MTFTRGYEVYDNNHVAVNRGRGYTTILAWTLQALLVQKGCFRCFRSYLACGMISTLAVRLESQAHIRNRVRGDPSGIITRWPKPSLIGVPSVKSMVLNVTALETVAAWWVEIAEGPSVIPIGVIREQA